MDKTSGFYVNLTMTLGLPTLFPKRVCLLFCTWAKSGKEQNIRWVAMKIAPWNGLGHYEEICGQSNTSLGHKCYSTSAWNTAWKVVIIAHEGVSLQLCDSRIEMLGQEMARS